jgi:hypothetical protein
MKTYFYFHLCTHYIIFDGHNVTLTEAGADLQTITEIKHKKENMINGLRVVRGPDWKHGNQDGGTDHVGTVIDGEGDDAVKVQWDMGSTSVCTVRNGTHELRILDSASIGIEILLHKIFV